ncbi:hypothetical protein AB7M22_005621 [Pseudomonas sp. ADAK2 TE3594]
MKHSVRAFYKTTERLAFRVDIPSEHFEQLKELKELMEWKEPDDPIYEYELSHEQIGSLEVLTGKKFDSPDYLFFCLVAHEKVGIYSSGRTLDFVLSVFGKCFFSSRQRFFEVCR